MGSCSFRDFEEVCKRLGLIRYEKTKGSLWEGIDTSGNYLSCMVHTHAGGRDIKDGTFHSMIKQLGFKDERDFKSFLADKKRGR